MFPGSRFLTSKFCLRSPISHAAKEPDHIHPGFGSDCDFVVSAATINLATPAAIVETSRSEPVGGVAGTVVGGSASGSSTRN